MASRSSVRQSVDGIGPERRERIATAWQEGTEISKGQSSNPSLSAPA
jgi:hypothetical protein